jgi:hypothetical protein
MAADPRVYRSATRSSTFIVAGASARRLAADRSLAAPSV